MSANSGPGRHQDSSHCGACSASSAKFVFECTEAVVTGDQTWQHAMCVCTSQLISDSPLFPASELLFPDTLSQTRFLDLHGRPFLTYMLV